MTTTKTNEAPLERTRGSASLPNQERIATGDVAEHTPGPWHACTREHYTLGGDSVEIAKLTADGQFVDDHIADVSLCTGDDTPEDRRVWKEQEANARLIAAAPELLEACNRCDAAFATWQVGQIPGRPEDILALVQFLRAAISKAEGRGS